MDLRESQVRPNLLERRSATVLVDRDWEGTPFAKSPTGTVVAGVGGARRNASVALCIDGQLRAFCEQERVTRVRRVGLESGRVPEEALDAVLQMAGRRRSDVGTFATAEASVVLPDQSRQVRIDHHLAHATTAYQTSPFARAAVIVCDEHSETPVSVWEANGGTLSNVPWPWRGCGFAELYSDCAEIFGFVRGQEQRLESLARLGDGRCAARLDGVFDYVDGSVRVRPDWKDIVAGWLKSGHGLSHRAQVASAVQARLGQLLQSLAQDVKTRLGGHTNLCLGGGLFYNTYFNTVLAGADVFRATFVPPNPGNAGLAAGAALAACASPAARPENGLHAVTPFLGPEFTAEQIKGVVDNCKLSYEYLNEPEVIAAVVDALQRGLLVGWFQGAMEWGPRALGNRSILASPFSPYVLDNLNLFLKHRERHSTYSLSVCEEDASRFFSGPPSSAYMEHDYQVKDPDLFRHVIPVPGSTIRVHTVNSAPRFFRGVLNAFGAATGTGVLVNTSLNAFSEPVVCTPRDAVRVFFGTGLDVLVLGRFLIRK